MDTFENYRENLKQIITFAFSHGLTALPNNHSQLGPEELLNELSSEKFRIACHDGFKIAQKRIIEEIQKYQTALRHSKSELKEYRKVKNKLKENEILSKIKIIERRLHNFSHIADGIAWQMLGGQIHLARRLYINDKSPKFLDSSNLTHAVAVADKINNNPNDFALLSDLTSYIQIGDLLITHDKMLTVMELKEGKVNNKIQDLFKSFDTPNMILSDEDLGKRFDTHTVKQIKRFYNQKKRANQAVEVMNTDQGTSPATGNNILVKTPAIETEFYHDELRLLYEDLQNKKWAYNVIDSCVHVGLYKDECIAMAPYCISEILKAKTENFIVLDWSSITENISEPIFAKPFPQEFILDILTGQVKMVIGLNLDLLIDVFNSCGLNTRWLTKKETAKYSSIIKKEPFFVLNHKGIAITVPGENESVVGGGTISKIIYDTIKPRNMALSFLSSQSNTENE